MSDGGPGGRAGRGRLFLVTGAQASERTAVARALAHRSPRAVAIEGSSFDAMVLAGGEGYDDPPTVPQLRMLFLRWSASLATAEIYLLEGFDAVISDAVLGGLLDDFLDLATPEPVHLVGVHSLSSTPPLVLETPRYGIWVDLTARTAEEAADEVLLRLDEALVLTAEATPESP
jgi:hypothetical protein